MKIQDNAMNLQDDNDDSVISAMRNKAIGVFDSGVGGLTVLEALRQRLPHEDFIYLGDTARVPYGNRTPQTIVKYATSCARQLVERDVKALVIACNTACAHALEALRSTFHIPVFGVIAPVSEQAVKTTQTQSIGVIGTRATISSQSYTRAIATLAPEIAVHSLACPLFVPLVEEGWIDSKATLMVVETYMDKLFCQPHAETIDTLILGCTHYPVLKTVIAQYLQTRGRNVMLCDCGMAAASVLEKSLETSGLLCDSDRPGNTMYFVTDDPVQFAFIGRSFMKKPPECVQHIDI